MAMLRMLDANLNRAREALRVMEDAARFALDDANLSGELKSIRHGLREAVDSLSLPTGVLEANRDVSGDVGREISTTAEMTRGGLDDVVIAAGKRLSESLRVIEELSKTLNANAAAIIQSLRYRAYAVDQRLRLALATHERRQWKLCLLLTVSLCKLPWRRLLSEAIDGGVDCVQVREKNMDDGDLATHTREIIALARPRGVAVIVNDRADVALAAGADGVHLGQHDLTVKDVRRLAGRELLVGVSTHTIQEARQAVESGADYCGVGTMFATALKPERAPSGPHYLRQFIEYFPSTPHLAIGGVIGGNISQLVEAGARGVAVSTALCNADDPQTIARQLRAALDSDASRRIAPLAARF